MSRNILSVYLSGAHIPFTPLNTAEAPRRELHRWIPTLPTPTTSGFSPVPHTPRSRVSGYSFQTGSLSPTPSGQSARFVNPHSRPISELDMLPTLHVAGPSVTPPPSARINQHAIGHVAVPNRLQDQQDPFSDPGPSYVRSIEADVYASPHMARESPVAAPPPAVSVRSSVDAMSITTSSTVPPSYRTHRPTVRCMRMPRSLPPPRQANTISHDSTGRLLMRRSSITQGGATWRGLLLAMGSMGQRPTRRDPSRVRGTIRESRWTAGCALRAGLWILLRGGVRGSHLDIARRSEHRG